MSWGTAQMTGSAAAECPTSSQIGYMTKKAFNKDFARLEPESSQ